MSHWGAWLEPIKSAHGQFTFSNLKKKKIKISEPCVIKMIDAVVWYIWRDLSFYFIFSFKLSWGFSCAGCDSFRQICFHHFSYSWNFQMTFSMAFHFRIRIQDDIFPHTFLNPFFFFFMPLRTTGDYYQNSTATLLSQNSLSVIKWEKQGLEILRH